MKAKAERGGEVKGAKRSLILSPRNDQLLSIAAKKRGCDRSALANAIFAEHFKGVRICWPGEPDVPDESAA